ncbi:MAG TPA: ATP-grasp domain-containing protein, partial [Chitinophagaceae bacterium]|nr:ATP-grasp domain-containing protein [Chitinophagaceae bacterium]
EIESVNVEALEQLEKEGVKIYPSPSVIKTINNKILQKQFYQQNQIPTAEFVVTNQANEIINHVNLLPAVHKIAQGGYDGKGVQTINTKEDAVKGFNAPSVLEKCITITKEIAIIIAVNDKKETAVYPLVEMIFDPYLNLLDYQFSPAKLPENIVYKVEAVALSVVKNLNSPGIFAVELFVDNNNNIWVNETAPRVHNSGHHTIEGNYSSQYDMLWRIILNFPLGNTSAILPSAIVNLIGSNNYNGNAIYDGLENILSMDNVFVHLYGKIITKPGRKMGHVTILSSDYSDLTYKANKIKNSLKVVA